MSLIGFLDQSTVIITISKIIPLFSQTTASFLCILTWNTSFSELFFFFSLISINSILMHENRCKHYASNMEIELLTITPERIIIIYRKTFIKIADLTYFN